MPISPHPTWEEAKAAHEETWALLGERSIESLIDLPPMTDPDMKVAMGALASLFGKAYVTDNHLLIIELSRMVSLTLRHGFTEAAVMGLGWFGVLTGTFFKRYREGLALAVLARGIVERYNLAAQRSSVLLSLEAISWFTQPLVERAGDRRSAASSMGSSRGTSIPPAGAPASIVINRLAMGHNLEDVYQEAVAQSGFVAKAGIVDPWESLGAVRSATCSSCAGARARSPR